jgi:hypothetical protein
MTDGDAIQFTVPPATDAAQLPARVKLQATIGIEKAIFPLGFMGLIACLVVALLSGGKHGRPSILTENEIWMGIGIGAAFFLAAFLIWALIDDYYVMDRNSRQIFLHTGFRTKGSDTPFLEFNQVLAVGMNCAEARGKYGQYGWTYTPVILVKNRDAIELTTMTTNMECSKLGEYNQTTRSWAAALACRWIECPPQQVFKVQQYFDPAVIDEERI